MTRVAGARCEGTFTGGACGVHDDYDVQRLYDMAIGTSLRAPIAGTQLQRVLDLVTYLARRSKPGVDPLCWSRADLAVIFSGTYAIATQAGCCSVLGTVCIRPFSLRALEALVQIRLLVHERVEGAHLCVQCFNDLLIDLLVPISRQVVSALQSGLHNRLI